MKKVGILTYHNTRNFGAVLQAYALQQTIELIGAECDIINYKCEHIMKNYKIKRIKEISSIKEFIKWALTVKDNKISQKKFEEFYQEKYKISSKVYTKKNISESNNDYNIFVTGSDQVWNMKLTTGDNTYFLDFVANNNMKVSYAASFGYKEVPKEYESTTKELIESFNYISVREKEGQNIVNKLLNKKAELVLDPTLLLEKKEWEKLCLNHKFNKEYILIYIVAPSPTLIDFAKRLSKRYNCEILCVHYSYKKIFGVQNLCDLSPQEFLTYVKNAKFVVTSSFHGLALSVELEKEVFYELDNNINNYNSRIETLANTLGILERQIIDGISIGEDKKINYKLVNQRLKEERKKSMKFIENFLIEE